MLTGVFDVTRDNEKSIVERVKRALQSHRDCQVLYQEISTIPDHQLVRGPENKLTRTYALTLYLTLASLGVYQQLPPRASPTNNYQIGLIFS